MAQALTARDHEQLHQHGVSIAEAERQLAVLRDPPAPLRLIRPCSLGSGVRQLLDSERDAALAAYESARASGRFTKFVPASGAASRMFNTLQPWLETGTPNIASRASAEDHAAADDARQLVANVQRFAFRDALASAFERHGQTLEDVVQRADAGALIRMLLSSQGLHYGRLPKGLLPFHRYGDEVRTAFEEHLVEAAAYAAAACGACRLHFTVSPQHRSRFEELSDRVRAHYESRFGVRYELSWSSQKPSTDTLAVDLDGIPFRTADGRLLLRPGGHGALLQNLIDLRADIVLIKNIDNVSVEDYLGETVLWKRLLAGHLCEMQRRVFEHLRPLRRAAPDADAVESAYLFVRDVLRLEVSTETLPHQPAERAASLRSILERPIRVCGMVPNTGEPGGGPVWIRDPNGGVSAQIVERAQIDPRSDEQQRLFDALTHFSPVDFACAVRDVDGQPFDLNAFVDPRAAIIVDKTHAGRPLRALEHPGLWNGGMARWLTFFVEVPLSTFNPVKTFADLLRPAHQGGDSRPRHTPRP